MIFNRLKWVYWVGFFIILALPLLNLPPWFSPPDWGKTIVFRIVLSILIFLFIYQILSSQRHNNFLTAVKNVLYKGKKVFSPFWLLIALLGINFLATVFSLDRNFSLWGSPYRSGGFVNFAFYIIFAILVFLILEDYNPPTTLPRSARAPDWQKIWDFSILIGIFVSIIAIFQWRGLFNEIFIPYEGRPPSTTGNPIFLAIYLLLLTFLTLSFALKEKKYLKKFLYFLSFLFFLFVIIFITQTRAAILGLAIGFLYFVFFFPFKKRSISLVFKIIIFALFVFGIYGFYYINTHPLPKFIQENKILLDITQRILIENIISDARVSAWKVSWQALKERPILGYGPENFSIGFDKFYDPSLPQIETPPGGGMIGWWDRAHNFIFDISITAGIPALIIYLLLFGILFWQLQHAKSLPSSSLRSDFGNANRPMRIYSQNAVIYQGIQATIIGYLVANFFSFDSFSSYLISFLLIGFSLRLISKNVEGNESFQHRFMPIKRIYADNILKWRGVIIFLLFVGLVWFIWNFNIKPLKINREIELARRFSEKGLCQKAIEKMEKILTEKSFLDHYLRLEYLDIIAQCVEENREMAFELAKKATEILKENTKIRPYYTRNWLLLGGYTNILIEGGEKNLKDEAISYFEKAKEISPKRQEIPLGLSKSYLLSEEYQKAKESAQECINLNARLGDCWWQMALINVYLGEEEVAKENMEIAKEKGYQIDSEISLLELAKAYLKREKYQELIKIYQKLIAIKPKNPKYYIALAVFYKETGQIEEAKKEALKILKLFPEYKEEVEEFLKTIR